MYESELQFYREHGYVRLPGVYSSAEVEALRKELAHLLQDFASRGPGWSVLGAWRWTFRQCHHSSRRRAARERRTPLPRRVARGRQA